MRTLQGSSNLYRTMDGAVLLVYNLGVQAFYGRKLHLILWAGLQLRVETLQLMAQQFS